MSSNSNTAGTGCPVDHTNRSPATCPVNHQPATDQRPVCPVDHSTSLKAFLPPSDTPHLDPHNQMPLTPEQTPTTAQGAPLSTARTTSSIPRADRYQAAGPSECPALHEEAPMWIYPSEQMFFNAMKRKNWNPHETDMKTVVPIHNAVNERCWAHILEWEQRHPNQCGGPKLLRFEGKAKELTPKARVRSWLGYQTPFDRHDWTVDRCGKQVRYVIDFYEGKRDGRNPLAPSFFLDVRPAMTVEGAWDRVRRLVGF
ncbi:Cytochrome c1 heme lyase [Coemansia spiralis]|uniref:Holocytochrome c-type synthase n=1 Tax=Coemansia spiralis TaxID=417178 RepID=A0A9W8GML0_9FUNG|nr:Cytochrome c1 heme lyase [Coemansia spiralis]